MAPHLKPIRAKRKRIAGDFRIVDRDEFFQLLLGFNHLVRADDPSQDMRGLRDTRTGVTYLIARDQLARRPAPQAIVG